MATGVDRPREELRKVALRTYRPANDPGAGKSSQPDPDDAFTPSESIPPPLDLELLAAQTHVSPTRRSCIAAVTLNTVGLGHRVEARKGSEKDLTPDEADELARALDELARRDRKLGRPTLTRLLSAVQWDRQEVGQGFLEVSRNRLTGQIDGLYHPPGKRIRRKKDRTGWIMGEKSGRPGDMTHFYDFGDKVKYDAEGRPQAKLASPSPGGWDRNELIAFQLYTSASQDYGLPPDAQLARDYLGDKLAANANVGYFGNSGVPPTVIFVKGVAADDSTGAIEVEVDSDFAAGITDLLRAGGAADSQVAVVPVPPGVETEKHDLAVLSNRDIGYVAYRADNRRRTLGAFRLSPIFVADIEDAGKYTAEVERAITKEQVFDPEQREFADVLTQTLLRELNPSAQLAFNEIQIKGDEARRQSANDLADRGKITNGELREAHGYPPMPEANEGDEPVDGQVPHGWNEQLVEAGNAAAAFPEEPPEDDPDAEIDDLFKRGSVDDLAAELDEEMTRAVDDAVRTLATMSDDAELRPLVIEKQGDGTILVTPYSGGGE